MINDVVLEVAMVNEVIELANGDEPHNAAGARRHQVVGRIGEYVVDEDVDELMNDVEDDVVESPRPSRIPGLPDPAARRGQRRARCC